MRRGLVLLATGTIVASAASAQQPARLPPGPVVQPMGRDDGAELRRHLTTLADNPRSVDALIGAGRAALRSGDAEAALSFFGRADEISPGNARIKAGIGSAMVQLGRPQPALGMFQQAVSLGAPQAEIAGDRGLAFDMLGDPRRAQQDYTAALRYRDDPEVRRRLALSLAISGEREAALRILEPQLRRNDRAAWRTQAFVLALTGDAAGAARTAQGSMPAGAAQAIAPFLARLPALSPGQKALAVHLGYFPARGQSHGGHAQAPADPGALALAMGGAPAAMRPAEAGEEPVRTASRRRPGRPRPPETRAERRRAPEVVDSSDPFRLRARGSRRPRREEEVAPPVERRPAEVAQVSTRWAGAPVITPTPAPPEAAPQPAPSPPPPDPIAQQPEPQRPQPGVQVTDVPAPAVTQVPAPEPGLDAPIEAAEPAAQPTEAVAPMTVADSPPAVPAREPPPSAPAASAAEVAPGFSLEQEGSTAATFAPAGSLADIASIVNALPAEESPAPAAREPAPARPAPAQPAAAAHPRRHWVQIAGSADRARLPSEFARLRARAPELVGRTAWTTPLNATNRLLVGPFGSEREAQAFVNLLAARDVASFAWTSAPGQEIHRLTGR
ncbi:MAG TPA: tetratricopeptide repeat protein [Allosphingosinicella sp.]